jgi:hypothetical protein
MNTITIVVAILTLWLVMGLGFMATYSTGRKKGKSTFEIWTSWEGILFIISVAVPLLLMVYNILN